MQSLSDMLKTLRKERGLTQEQLGAVLNVSAQAVSRWENGVSLPDVAMLPAIAAFFEVTVDALLGVCSRRVEQRMIHFQFRCPADEEKINQYLENGWYVKEMHTHALDDGNHPEGVAILEKVTMQ